MVDASWFKSILRWIWILFDNAIFVFVYAAMHLLSFPVFYISPSLYFEFDSWWYREVMHSSAYWAWSAGYKIVEYGDLPWGYIDDRCLVVANHQTVADVLVLASAIAKKGVSGGKIMWILHSGCQHFLIPNIFITSLLREDFYIVAGKKVLLQQLDQLANHMRKNYWSHDRRWFIVFPEGSHLPQQKSGESTTPNYDHAMLPRTGAVKTMLDTANPMPNKDNTATIAPPGPGFRYLIDITIGFSQGNPVSLVDIGHGTRPPCEMGIHYRRIPIDEVPYRGYTSLRQYLYSLWLEKDFKLAHFKQHGHFPGIPRSEGVVINYHKAGMILHHAIFYIMAYFLFSMILRPLYYAVFL